MEELNSKSPLLAHAMTGSRKKLLSRVKRLINRGKFRKGFREVIIVVLIVIGMASAFSMNAFSVIPNSFDLTGRESGGKIYNLLPLSDLSQLQNHGNNETTAGPDTIIATSGSGRVIVKVYTDSTGADDEKNLQVFVENLDHQVGKWERANDEYDKEVIILKKNTEERDSVRKVIIIKVGDSVKIIKNDTVLVFPKDYDTSFTTENGFLYYEFDSPELNDIPEIPDISELNYIYFDGEQAEVARELERAMRDQEFNSRELEKAQRDLERGHRELIYEFPGQPGIILESERIIRQELRDDGLTSKGRNYLVELDGKAMYINGEKQAKETYRKYRKLVESLNQTSFENGDNFKIIF